MSVNFNFRDLEGFEYIAKKNPQILRRMQKKHEAFFNRAKRKFSKLVSTKVQRRFEVITSGFENVLHFGLSGTRFLQEVIPQAENVAKVAEQFFDDVESFTEKIERLKIFTFISIPFVGFETARKVHNLVMSIINKAPSRVVDSILELGECAADITRIVAVLAGNSIAATAAGFLSVFAIANNSKQLFHSVRFYRRMVEKFGNPIADFSDRQLKRRLDVSDGGMFRARMQYIWKRHAHDSKVLDHVKGALKRKAIQKGVSNVLRIVASAISIVATAILLFAPPLAPIAFGLFAGAALIRLTDFIVDKAMTYYFLRVVRGYAPSDMPEVQQYKKNYDRYKKLGLI